MTDSHKAGGAQLRTLATLDGPAGMTLAAPRYRTLRIVINGPDDSEPPIVIERHDWPVADDDELDPADVDPASAAAAARVRAAFARPSTLPQDAPGEPDEVLPEGEAETRSPCQRSVNCGHCGRPLSGDNPRKRYCRASCRVMACRARKATPVLFEREDGRR